MRNILCVAAALILVLECQTTQDYYWRDWNGTVPLDAYVAGNDSRGKIYIAQGYVYNYGLYVGELINSERSIKINPTLGSSPVITSNVLKVLCINPVTDTFRWLPSNRTLTPEYIKYTNTFKGGVAFNNNTIYVGRFVLNNYTYIANVHSDYYAYYTNNVGGGAYTAAGYDILIYAIY